MKACIIIPTYNEAANIEPLLKEIFTVTKAIKGWEAHVLIVDDKSPDGTGKLVKKLQKKHARLHLLEGRKQGLGVAYIRGMRHAMKTLKPDAVFEMDADHSHPPALLPRFLKEVERGADFVIGSRYIPGGGTPQWPVKRRLMSKGANFLARVIAGLYGVKDCTSGYRCISTKLLKRIDLKRLGAKGYSFQMNLLSQAIRKGGRVKEIPLVFHDRQQGESKMRFSDIAEFFLNAVKLRLQTWERFIKFAIVGGTGVLVNMGVLAAVTELAGVTYQVSSLIAIETAIIWNFFLNHKWTFRKSTNPSSTFVKLLKFNAVSIVGAAINWGVLVLLTEAFGVFYLLSNLAGIAVAVVWNYLANAHYTWRDAPVKKG
ncbi:MAG: GtrA family protein [Candidatus Woesearchaeota archaeon]